METIEATPLAAATTDHGGKAEGLAALIQAGLPVPPGLVFGAGDAAAPALAEAAAAIARTSGWRTVAVRSSSAHEDGAMSSGAGAYETVLSVPSDDVDALTEAIDTVLTSIDGQGGVIVQRMMPADAAGVAFTVDPVTGAETVVVDAVAGLGAALVSGEVTPWEVRIPRHGDGSVADAALSADDGAPLDGAALAEVVRLALAAEEARGGPQDVEWAVVGGQVWLLQSRPITALVEQIPVEVVVPPGYWMRDPTHGRLPRSRMTVSVIDEGAATAPMVSEFGMLATFEGARIGGWHYLTIVPVGAPPPAPGKTPPRLPGWLISTLIRLSAAGRRQLRAARRAMKTDAAGHLFAEWNATIRSSLRAEVLAFQDVDLGGLDDAALAAELRARAALIRRTAELHFRLAIPYSLGIHGLVEFCRAELGWTSEQALELLSGLADVAAEPGRALAELALLPEDSPERADAYERFTRFYGCRALDIEVAEPTLAESPHLLAALIDAATHAGTVDVEAAQADGRRRVAGRARAALKPSRVASFDRVLAAAEQVYGLRDDNVFLTIDAPLALVRYAAIEAGRRLCERGTLDAALDVFHLTTDEAAQALGSKLPLNDTRERARRGRGERAWAIAHPGPFTYGQDPGPGPKFTALTRAERTPTEAEMLMGDLIMMTVQQNPDADGLLHGAPASSGRVTGTARIVHDEAGFRRIERGDIVVCPGTRPSWSVIFPLIGGLVADAGGALSHPAIIAREYGIPAVVAVAGATNAIRDGETITVDGTAGTVRRHTSTEASRRLEPSL